MDVHNLMLSPGPNVFYDRAFTSILESHIPLLREASGTQVVAIDAHKARVYEGDFYGYLNAVGIGLEHHWIIMRVNKMRSPADFKADMTTLYIPDKGTIQRLQIVHRSVEVIEL